MKTTLFLSCIALVICAVISDDESKNGIDESFLKKDFVRSLCDRNQTFGPYKPCTKTCLQKKPPANCPDVTFFGCFCVAGHIPLENSYSRCVKEEDCP
ncbi:hypothetical protein NPIL_345631 [Nephila pilipes]|uniref:TIL domain-containing protein n=1 Tax=Nephila pilipes TaxID=299642 RepID=A0A8X6NSN7_NEPPI|nr:hypothetical protein NPIL_345631 [Nephila pilipes]